MHICYTSARFRCPLPLDPPLPFLVPRLIPPKLAETVHKDPVLDRAEPVGDVEEGREEVLYLPGLSVGAQEAKVEDAVEVSVVGLYEIVEGRSPINGGLQFVPTVARETRGE